MASPNNVGTFANDLRMLSENSTGSSVARRSLMDSLKYAQGGVLSGGGHGGRRRPNPSLDMALEATAPLSGDRR